jgi:cytoskeleton protein RodZ
MSTIAAEDDAVAGAPRVGADLSAARQRLGWSLEGVAAGLRIRLPFLVALEEGRIADLPGNAYALGFLRTYATALGLDPDEMARRFRVEAANVNQLTRLSFPAPVPSRGVPAGAVVLLGVVLAIGAYVGWYRLSGNGELPPEVVAPVPARLAPLAERAVPPPPLAGSSVTQTSPGAQTPGQTAAAQTAAAQTAAAQTAAARGGTPGGLSLAAGSPAIAMLDQPAPEPSVPPTQAAAATTAQVLPAVPQPRIVLSATADAWLQVRDKSGPILLNRVLHAGETWTVPVQANLVLTTGNAGGTDIVVDGASTPSLGISGAVRRDIPLDPDLLKAGRIPSASLPMTTANAGATSGSGSGIPAPYRSEQ